MRKTKLDTLGLSQTRKKVKECYKSDKYTVENTKRNRIK